MELDPVLLARIQFAANISFHILFPAITIGLAWILLFFRLRYTRTGDRNWEYAYFFWVKIFALSFAIGIVTGVTMSFQFGTNWPGFMERAGNIAAPLLGYEVLTAFFLEASFLGIMLFGKNLVSNRTHLVASGLVAAGTTLSAFWILALSSWMQTPAGYRIEDGMFQVENWLQIIFNPTLPYRFTHMLNASLLTSAFFIMGVSAWRMRRNVHGPATWKVFKTGLAMAAVLAPLQAVIGDLHGLHTLDHQPAKIAAVEAVWETGAAVPFTLFGFPDEEARETAFAVEIPYLASWLLTHDPQGELLGLNEFGDDHPPVAPVFWSFRVMVGIGLLMIGLSWWGAWQVFLRRRQPGPLMLRAFGWMTWAGWVGVVAGWWVTEIGRQPWMVQGLLRVEEVVADHGGGVMLGTLSAYLLLYAFIGVSFVLTLRYMSTKPAASLLASDLNFPRHAGVK